MKPSLVATALFLAVFAAVFLSLESIRTAERQTYFESSRTSFKTVVELICDGISSGYFQWDDVRQAVLDVEKSTAWELIRPISTDFKYILKTGFESGSPYADGRYAVSARGLILHVTFDILDNEADRVVPTTVGFVDIDAIALSKNVLDRRFTIAMNGEKAYDFVYGLRAIYSDPGNFLRDLMVVVPLSTLMSVFYLHLRRKNTRVFYEARGLDSIIFMFEQTEKYSANHSRNVAHLSAYIAGRLGLKGKRLKDIYVAGLLHDIGKIGIPVETLTKAGPLDNPERIIMERHPAISAEILSYFTELAHLSDIVRYHHERMDGSGYPEGLVGEAIPFESRIVAVVDVFEALTGERPYRKPMSIDKALAELRKQAFDQRIVEELAAGLEDYRESPPSSWDRLIRKPIG